MPAYDVRVESSVATWTNVRVYADSPEEAGEEAIEKVQDSLLGEELEWETGCVHPDDSLDVTEIEETS
jgi:hypothetical protein